MKEQLKDIIHLIDSHEIIRLYDRFSNYITETRSNDNSLKQLDDLMNAQIIRIYSARDENSTVIICIQLFY